MRIHDMPTHELFINKNGTTSLREIKSGEVMHSSVGPREEATLLYIEQSRLAERLTPENNKDNNHALTLFDVGLGAATNALAALQCFKKAHGESKKVRPLKLISFENDPSGLQLALENSDKFPFFENFEKAVSDLLSTGHWQSDDHLIDWRLYTGDFRDHVAKVPCPEVIFFDFYSPKVVPELWTVNMFESLWRLSAKAENLAAGTTLYTYSSSTRVRVALLLAGFFVGYGKNTGAKSDTTVASTQISELARPLDARWLERLERSHASVPHGWDESRKAEMFERVLSHPQFKK